VGLGADVSLALVDVPLDAPVSEVVCVACVNVVVGAVADCVGRVAEPPGVPGAVEEAEMLVALAPAELEESSFSAMENGELVATTLLMLETSTN